MSSQFSSTVCLAPKIRLKDVIPESLLNMTLKGKKWLKEKIDKLNFIKIKKICALKDTIKKVKRQFTEWINILINHISDKRHIQNILKKYKSITKRQPNLKMDEGSR